MALINSKTHSKKLMLRERTVRAWFIRLLRHPARKRSRSILTTLEPAWGNLAKLVPESQTILGFTAARDDGAGIPRVALSLNSNGADPCCAVWYLQWRCAASLIWMLLCSWESFTQDRFLKSSIHLPRLRVHILSQQPLHLHRTLERSLTAASRRYTTQHLLLLLSKLDMLLSWKTLVWLLVHWLLRVLKRKSSCHALIRERHLEWHYKWDRNDRCSLMSQEHYTR